MGIKQKHKDIYIHENTNFLISIMVQIETTNNLLCTNIESYQCMECLLFYDSFEEIMDHRHESGHKNDLPQVFVSQDWHDRNRNKAIGNSTTNSYSHSFSSSTFDTSTLDKTACRLDIPEPAEIQNGEDHIGRSWYCVECNFVTNKSVTLRHHLKTVHYKCKCNICGKKYKNESILQEHIKQIHRREHDYNCTTCNNYSTSNRAYFLHHLSRCSGEQRHEYAMIHERKSVIKPYVAYCRITDCDSFFTSNSLFQGALSRRRKHECAHDVEDKYECFYCKTLYRNYSDFLQHLARCCIKFSAPGIPTQVPPINGKYHIFI